MNGVNDIVRSMKANGWVGDPINVVHMADGGLTSVDNYPGARLPLRRNRRIRANVHAADDALPVESRSSDFTSRKR